MLWILLSLLAIAEATSPLKPSPKPDLQCGDYEFYDPCPKKCTPRLCSSLWSKFRCVEDDVPVCKPECMCTEGRFRDGANGPCITGNECMGKCDENAHYERNLTTCRKTCDNYQISGVNCKPFSGCVCDDGFVREYNNATGPCIPVDKCRNGCPIEERCRPTCSIPNPKNCPKKSPCSENIDGCQCKTGYVLSKIGGKCVKEEECQEYQSCDGDRNATYKECPLSCRPTCDSPNAVNCTINCDKPGCECKPGYILSKTNGKCILPEDCKCGYPCPKNETFVPCKAGCPTNYCPKDDGLGIIACSPPYPCPPGCVCKANHKRISREDEKCILASDCPPVKCTRPNEVWDSCPTVCLRESCSDIGKDPPVCHTAVINCSPKCVCEQGYYRNDTGYCVPADKCPKPPPKCGFNEVPTNCTVTCPPESCDISYTSYLCVDPKPPCEAGCKCKDNHLRNSSGICILNDECPGPKPQPICGYNEEPTDCSNICPPESCDISYTTYSCPEPRPPCKPGCKCIKDHLRNATGICILNDKCPPPTPEPEKCKVPVRCRPTCAVPNPTKCPAPCNVTDNVDGCQCKKGYILAEKGGKCIKIEECPKDIGCNGDKNSEIKACPWQKPSTCASPNAVRGDKCTTGCQCKDGYLLSKKNGKCISPDKCPGGNPCGVNGTFVECAFRCPNQYCPKDNSGSVILCKPVYPCPSGCFCKENYLRKSQKEDNQCILATDCAIKPCKIPQGCRPTCAVPNPKNCPVPKDVTTNIDGCQCKKGYILSEKGGKCIKVEECPQNLGCNGDMNSEIKACPWEIPSTCASPNAVRGNKCVTGCQCKNDYILSEKDGKCIPPDQCPGGNPCGVNGTFVECAFRCPNQYCPEDDSGAIILCRPLYPCPSGCFCKPEYLRKSQKEDNQCLLSSDCPQVECTRSNEIWNSCPSPCLSERCEDRNNEPSTCIEPCDRPKCVCVKGYCRDREGNCVSDDKCAKNT